jgi:Ni,Fe-hydrogenase I large subunit
VFITMPWQPYLITALAAFTGEIVEGFVIDSDHWRHFYLLIGMIWGLSIATMNAMQRGTPGPAHWGRMPNVRSY